jgi:hypothetical protein
MAATLTLAQVRAKVRAHIDEPVEAYWTDSELNGLISDSELELWTKITELRVDYFLSPTGFDLTLIPGTYRYTAAANGIPTDIWRIVAIQTITPGYQDLTWAPGNPTTREWVDGLRSDVVLYNPYRMYYALRAIDTIDVSPLPQNNVTAQVDYIQQPTPMVNDTDTFLLPDAFMDFVHYNAAALALMKGPVGDSVGWAAKAADAQKRILTLLDTPRSDQGPDTVIGFSENAAY